MTTREAPALALWLLQHLGGGYRSESLAGDLLEEYQHGKSTLWFWNQVGAAIFVARWRSLRALASWLARAILWALVELAVVVGAVALADAGTKSTARCDTQIYVCHESPHGSDSAASTHP